MSEPLAMAVIVPVTAKLLSLLGRAEKFRKVRFLFEDIDFVYLFLSQMSMVLSVLGFILFSPPI